MENKFNLPNNQMDAIKNGEVFSKVATFSMDDYFGDMPKGMKEGVIFMATDIKLIAKDGSNDVLSAIGIKNFEDKIDQTNRCFRPTTFEELVIAFEYTGYNGLSRFFRMGDENNLNINNLMCSFLKNNLDSDNVDVKALASTSFEVKEIVDQKAEKFYKDKVDFFNRKIEKYQSRIESLRQEQNHIAENGEQFQESEVQFGEAMESYLETMEDSADVSQVQSVEELLKYFNSVKEANVQQEASVNAEACNSSSTQTEDAAQ